MRQHKGLSTDAKTLNWAQENVEQNFGWCLCVRVSMISPFIPLFNSQHWMCNNVNAELWMETQFNEGNNDGFFFQILFNLFMWAGL